MSDRRAELEAAIDADPYDPRGYAVLGDHLQEIGDPRGELIALQLDRKAGAVIEATEHLERHRDVFGPPPQVAFRWANGYARAVVIEPSSAHATRAALAHPSCRFVVELRIHGGNVPLDGVIAAIAAAPRPTLRILQLGDNDNRGPDFTIGIQRAIGDLSQLWPAVPQLEEIEIAGSAHSLGDVDLPRATRFVLDTKRLTSDTANAIANASWPALRSLHVLSYASWYLTAWKTPLPPAAVTKAMCRLLSRRDVPALTDLRLRGMPATNTLIGPLAISPLLPRLTRVDLSEGALTDAGLETLLQRVDAFRHLDELDVSGNYLSRTGIERLAKALPNVDVADQAFTRSGGGDPPDDEQDPDDPRDPGLYDY